MQVIKLLWSTVMLACLGWLLLVAEAKAQTAPVNQALTFERVKVLLYQNGKTKEVAVRLRLTGTAVIVEEAATGKAMTTIQNDELKASEYYYSLHRRGGSLYSYQSP